MPFDQNYVASPKTEPHPSPAANPVAEILRKARALIEKPSAWGRCDLHDKDTGRRCIYGALEAAGTIGEGPIREALIEAVGTFPADSYWATSPRSIVPMMFNDCPRTTHADVLALFDRAIAAAEQA